MEYVTNFSRGCFHHWTASKAIMELVQNALDSDGDFQYEFGDNYIELTNKDIKVSNKLLMMGKSDKRNDDTKRGQFGVGSIQAMVVLTDLDIGVDIHNNDVCWTPSFKYCDKFDEDIMVITETPCTNGSNYSIFITGLDEYTINEVRQRCLVFQDREVLHSTQYGDIISNIDGEGEVYCGDLFVCQNPAFKYSYNFKPKGIKLSQDRDAVSQWDLQNLTAKLIIASGDDNFIKQAIRENSVDTSQINTQWSCDPNTSEELDNDFADEFLAEHGAKLVTSSHSEYEENKKLGNSVVYIGNERIVKAIKRSELYQSVIESIEVVEKESFETLLLKTLDRMEYLLYSNGLIDYTQQNTDKERTGDNEIVDWLDEIKDRVSNSDFE